MLSIIPEPKKKKDYSMLTEVWEYIQKKTTKNSSQSYTFGWLYLSYGIGMVGCMYEWALKWFPYKFGIEIVDDKPFELFMLGEAIIPTYITTQHINHKCIIISLLL